MRLNNVHMCKYESIFPICAMSGEEMTWYGRGCAGQKKEMFLDCLLGLQAMWLLLCKMKLRGTRMYTQPAHHCPSEPRVTNTGPCWTDRVDNSGICSLCQHSNYPDEIRRRAHTPSHYAANHTWTSILSPPSSQGWHISFWLHQWVQGSAYHS